MLNYISIDAVKSFKKIDKLEDITESYHSDFNYSYTEITDIYQSEIDFKETLLKKYQNCKIQSEFTKEQIEKILNEIRPYFKELARIKGKAREEQAIERQRQIVERFENQERKTIDTSAFICYGD